MNREKRLDSFQDDMFRFYRLYPGSPAYHLTYCATLHKELNFAKMKIAFATALELFPELSCRYLFRDGISFQLDHDGIDALPIVRRDSLNREDLFELIDQKFDLERKIPVRIILTNNYYSEPLMCIVIHHICSNFYRFQGFLGAFACSYLGFPVSDSQVTLRKKKIDEDHKSYLSNRRWWKRIAKHDALFCLDDPSLSNNPDMTYIGCTRDIMLKPKLANSIREKARHFAVTPYVYVLHSFLILLHQLGNAQNIVLGTPVRGIDSSDEMKVMPIVFSIDDVSLRESLKSLHKIFVQSYRCSKNLSTAEMLSSISADGVGRSISAFDILYAWNTIDSCNTCFDTSKDGLVKDLIHFSSNGISGAQSKIMLTVLECGEKINFKYTYAKNFYTEKFIQYFQQLHLSILDFESTDDCLVSDIGNRMRCASSELFSLVCGDNVRYSNEGIVDSFISHAENIPNKIAIRFRDECVNYSVLLNMVRGYASSLIKNGVRRLDIIATFLPRSISQVVCALSIQYVGGVYLPIDVSTPKERVLRILAQSNADFLVKTKNDTLLFEQNRSVKYIDIEMLLQSGMGLVEPPIIYESDDPVYLIYTSGSTGMPKGALNRYAGLKNRLYWMKDYLDISTTDVILYKTSPSFDVSIWELFLPFIVGAEMAIADDCDVRDPKKLLDIISRANISVMHMVPSLLHVFLGWIKESGSVRVSLRGIKKVICSGEELNQPVINLFYSLLAADLYNFYGPTEASIDVTACKCSPINIIDRVSIGQPISNVSICIVSDDGSVLPRFSVGRVVIRGVAVALGYWNDRERTAQSFVTIDCFGQEVVYDTGDTGYIDGHGAIYFLGRRDRQIKLRGFRIELGEIDACLMSYAGVNDAVSLLYKVEENEYIHSFIESKNSSAEEAGLKVFLEKQLPCYMIPSRFTILSKIPRLSSGKVDRNALNPKKNVLSRSLSNLRSDEFNQVYSVICKVLGKNEIPLTTSLYEYGLNSIATIRIVSKIERIFSMEIMASDILREPSIVSIANLVLGSEKKCELDNTSDQDGVSSLELNHAEKQILAHSLASSKKEAYNMYKLFHLHGNIDFNRLIDAIKYCNKRYKNLGAEIKIADSKISLELQKIPIELEVINLSEKPLKAARAYIVDACTNDAKIAIDPLMPSGTRIILYICGDHDCFMYLKIHHVFVDGWGIGAYFEDLVQFYNEGRLPHRLYFNSIRENQLHLKYWQEKFASLSEAIEKIPFSESVGNSCMGTGKIYQYKLGASKYKSIERSIVDTEKSLFVYFLERLARVIADDYNLKCFSIGTVFYNRHSGVDYNNPRAFVTTVPILVNILPGASLGFSLYQSFLDASEHQNISMRNLVDCCKQSQHDPGRLYDVLIVHLDKEEGHLNLNDVITEPIYLDNHTSKYPLVLYLVSEESGLSIIMQYDDSIHTSEFIESLCARLLDKVDVASILPSETKEHKVSFDRKVPITGENNESLVLMIEALVLVLSNKEIDESKSFFENGGDSIAAIRWVYHVRRLGYEISLSSVYENQSIIDICANADKERESGSCASAVISGSFFPLFPMQAWFFNQAHDFASQWVQYIMLKPRVSIDASDIEVSLKALFSSLDVFFLRFVQKSGVWYQSYSESINIQFHVLNASFSADDLVTRYFSDLSLDANVLGHICIVRRGQYVENVFIMLHHLLIDVVSWSMLLEYLNFNDYVPKSVEPVLERISRSDVYSETSPILRSGPSKCLVSDGQEYSVLFPHGTLGALRGFLAQVDPELKDIYLANMFASCIAKEIASDISLVIESADRALLETIRGGSTALGWLSTQSLYEIRLDALPDTDLVNVNELYALKNVHDATSVGGDSQNVLLAYNYISFGLQDDVEDNVYSIEELGYKSHCDNYMPYDIELNILSDRNEYKLLVQFSPNAASAEQIKNAVNAFLWKLSKPLQYGFLPKTPFQSMICLQHRTRTSLAMHFNVARWQMLGDLDKQKFKSSYQFLANNISIFKIFINENEEIVFDDNILSKVDVRFVDAGEKDTLEFIEGEISKALAAPMDISLAPLMSLVVYTLSNNKHYVIWKMHQYLLDGWSVNQLFTLWMLFYNYPLRSNDVDSWLDYDYIKSFKYLSKSAITARYFWKGCLSGVTHQYHFLDAECPYTRMSEVGISYALELFTCTKAATKKMKYLATKWGVTQNALYNTIWCIFLLGKVKREYLFYGVMSSGRFGLPSADSLMGPMSNIVGLKVEANTLSTIVDFARHVQKILSRVMQQTSLPLNHQVDSANMRGDIYPFDHYINFQNYPDTAHIDNSFAGLSIDGVQVLERVNAPLAVRVTPGIETIFKFIYNNALLEKSTVVSIKQCLSVLVECFISTGDFNITVEELIYNYRCKKEQLCSQKVN